MNYMRSGFLNCNDFSNTVTANVKGNRSETATDFVFKKGNTKMIECNITEAANMLQDNQEAWSVFTKQFGSTDKTFLPKQLQNHPQVIFNSIDIYNGDKN